MSSHIHFFFYSQGGKLDLAAAARIVLRDWSTGKLSRYAVPPAVSGSGTAADAVSTALATIYEGDTALLEKLPPRKEMCRTRDLVRLSSERVDDRTLALDAPWFNTDGVSDSDTDDDDDEACASELESEVEAEEIGSGADDVGDSEEDAAADDAGLGVLENEEDEDEVPQSSSSARKRKRLQPPAPSSKSQSGPRKKVAFASSVKEISSSKDHTPLSRPSKTRPSPHKKSNVNARAPARTKSPPPPSRSTRKSAANAPPPTTAQRRKPGAGEGEYDFSKFF